MYMYAQPSPIVTVLISFFRVYQLVLLARILCSWFPVDRRSTWYVYLYRATEPFLAPFRQLLPPMNGIDFSPIAAFIALDIVRMVVVRVLI